MCLLQLPIELRHDSQKVVEGNESSVVEVERLEEFLSWIAVTSLGAAAGSSWRRGAKNGLHSRCQGVEILVHLKHSDSA